MYKVTHRRLEAGRGDILRQARLALLDRFIPLGNFGGGPGWRCLAVMTVLHYLGRPLFIILIRYERQLTGMYRRLKSIRSGGQS